MIASPYAGDIAKNVAYAHRALEDSLLRREAPLAAHLLYTQVLHDNDPKDRKAGIEATMSWLYRVEGLIVYCDRGVSSGMKAEIRRATQLRIPIEYRFLDR